MDVFMLQFGLELHLLKTDAARKQHVHKLTVCRSCDAEIIWMSLNRITQSYFAFQHLHHLQSDLLSVSESTEVLVHTSSKPDLIY